MNGKIPCIACGADILRATADRNGGKCVPCKLGTRESIEESKRRLQEERDRPPEPDYWRPLVAKESLGGLDAMSPAERTYFCACLLDGEVYNGGFEQFFGNSSGDYYYETEASLVALELGECLDLFRQAKQIVFGNESVPVDRQIRNEVADAALQNPASARSLDALDHRFLEAFKKGGDRVDEFAVRNQLDFIMN